MAQLEHRLAIIKIVAGKELIEPDEVLPQVLQLRLVKVLEEGRDRIRREHRRQAGQHSRQFRVHFGEFLDGLVRRGNPRPQFQIEDITLGIGAFVGGRAAGNRIDRRVDGDPTKETRGLEPARDYRRLGRRGRGRRFFRNLDLDRCVQRASASGAIAPGKSSAGQSPSARRGTEKTRGDAASSDEIWPRQSGYFLIQAMIAMMTPITLSADINPAGMA